MLLHGRREWLRGCLCDCDFYHVESFRGSSVQGEGDIVIQNGLVPLGLGLLAGWHLCWVPLCEEGGIAASMPSVSPSIPSLPLQGGLRVQR